MSKSIARTAVLALALCAVAAPVASAAGPRLGSHKCFETFREVSQINGEVTYATQYRDTLILRKHRVYEESLRVGPGSFGYHSHRLAFRGGSLDSDSEFWHVGGRYYPGGRKMPHSTRNPSRLYPIVLRDLRADDSDTAPPFAQFDARQNATFWYCAR